MSPRVCRVVALPKPTDAQKSQWYFQRYVTHLPSAGEMVLFDRSWYNRAGVEKVMGFASPEQVESFYKEAPLFELSLINAGVRVIKIWLEVSDAEQEKRFTSRLKHSWKRWKLSPMDLFARSKWTEYARARDIMLERTDSEHAHWWVVDSDNKWLAQLNTIQHILRLAGPYEDIPTTDIKLPPRESTAGYVQPDRSKWHAVPQIYHPGVLKIQPSLLLKAASLEISDLANIRSDVKPGPEQ
jgi:polyphosphate kinase 2 (PPK2 family)